MGSWMPPTSNDTLSSRCHTFTAGMATVVLFFVTVASFFLGTNEVSPIEMAGAYGTLDNKGMAVPPKVITKVTKADGTVLYQAQPEAKPTGGSGSVVQLGAFANQAQAERAWTALSGRFPSVAALNKMVVPFSGGIRLRAGAASPADAKQVCQTLKAAGENCFVAQ